jgi:hypothetical protein
MFGYQRDELVGQTIEILKSERYRDRQVAIDRGHQYCASLIDCFYGLV